MPSIRTSSQSTAELKSHSSSPAYTRWKNVLKSERLPAVVVDLEAFDHNISVLAHEARIRGKKIRIATKSIRVVSLIKRVLSHGYPFEGLMCFSAEEAEFLASEGLSDFLVAYPTVQPSDLRALRTLHEQGKKISLVVDSPDQVRTINEFMQGVSQPFSIVIEVDASLRILGGRLHLGVRRSPLRTAKSLGDFLDRVCSGAANLRVEGVMTYEAQVAGLGDQNPFKKWLNPVASWVRQVSMKKLTLLRAEVAKVFAQRNLTLEIFNGGGSGSFNLSSTDEHLTELTAGSALVCSHLFDYFSNIKFEPACFFALQVVRSSDAGYVTCAGGGYIGSGEPGWDKVPQVVVPAAGALVAAEGCGEVQTPVFFSQGNPVSLGDPILFRHAKAGELAERFNEYLLVSATGIEQRVKTYRGMGKCFF